MRRVLALVYAFLASCDTMKIQSPQCPISIGIVFLLRPEGVLQRALEVGYRNCYGSDKFKVSSTLHT